MANEQLPIPDEPPKSDAEYRENVRVLRHNVRNLQATQLLQGESLLLFSDRLAQARVDIDKAFEKSRETEKAVLELQYDIYGHPDRHGDEGMFGALRADIAGMKRLLVGVFLALLGVIATGILDAIVRAHG